MGRPKAYERDDVLARAMDVFWADGYHHASARQLADAMGINLSTLYSEFGSKDGLYVAALDRYEREVVSAFFGPLEASDASIDTVRDTLRLFPAMAQQVAVAHGCLVTNAAVERAPSAPASQDAMAAYVDRIAAGIVHALTNGPAALAAEPRAVQRLARQLVAVLLGLFVLTRAQVDPEVLDDMAESAVAQVDAFAAESDRQRHTRGAV